MQAAEGYGIGPVVEGEPAHEVDRRFKHADGIQRRIIGQAERDFLVAAGYVAFERGAAPGAPLGGKYRFPGGVTPHENAVMIFLVLVEQARFDEIFDDAGGDAAPAQVGAYALVIVIGRGKDEWGPLSPGRRPRSLYGRGNAGIHMIAVECQEKAHGFRERHPVEAPDELDGVPAGGFRVPEPGAPVPDAQAVHLPGRVVAADPFDLIPQGDQQLRQVRVVGCVDFCGRIVPVRKSGLTAAHFTLRRELPQ